MRHATSDQEVVALVVDDARVVPGQGPRKAATSCCFHYRGGGLALVGLLSAASELLAFRCVEGWQLPGLLGAGEGVSSPYSTRDASAALKDGKEGRFRSWRVKEEVPSLLIQYPKRPSPGRPDSAGLWPHHWGRRPFDDRAVERCICMDLGHCRLGAALGHGAGGLPFARAGPVQPVGRPVWPFKSSWDAERLRRYKSEAPR